MEDTISLKKAISSPATIIALICLGIAGVLWIPANQLIHVMYPDRPIVPDVLFTILPVVPWLAYASDLCIAGSIAVLAIQIFHIDRRRMPYYFLTIAVLYISRAFLMVLTPLGRPTGNLDHYGLLKLFGGLQHGMFPSGHQMFATLTHCLVDGKRTPRLKLAALVLVILQAAVLLLSRGHYSIDIVGGILVAWFVVERFGRQRQRFTIIDRSLAE
jgi:membrane-associated phospholipid phosphatase